MLSEEPICSYCLRHFSTEMFKSTPPITRHLLIINIIIFMLQLVLRQRGIDLTDSFGLHFFMAEDFHIYQLLSYMFLHGSWEHVLMNMFSLWMFGRIVEQTMQSRRYIAFYLICGIGAGLCQEVWQLGEYYISGLYAYDGVNLGTSVITTAAYLNMWNTVGASGAVYGILLAFGMTFPNERIMLLFPPIPMKAKYMVAIFAVIEMAAAFTSNGNVAHFAHIGGMLFGFLLIRYWRRQDSGTQFKGWDSWNPRSNSLWQRVKGWFKSSGSGATPPPPPREPQNHQSDYNYNARQRQKQERVDQILDKIKKSGYESLTEEEKRELFDITRNP